MQLADISAAIGQYRSGAASLDEFADWYHEASAAMFSEPPDVLGALISLDSAFSQLRCGNIGELIFRDVLLAQWAAPHGVNE